VVKPPLPPYFRDPLARYIRSNAPHSWGFCDGAIFIAQGADATTAGVYEWRNVTLVDLGVGCRKSIQWSRRTRTSEKSNQGTTATDITGSWPVPQELQQALLSEPGTARELVWRRWATYRGRPVGTHHRGREPAPLIEGPVQGACSVSTIPPRRQPDGLAAPRRDNKPSASQAALACPRAA
jgi:hypothetical protein